MSAEALETRVARETPEVQAWAQLLRAHSALTRRFSTELLTMHGLTLSGYEVLLHLAHTPDQRLRRVDLAERVLLTPSGITRLLDGLEHFSSDELETLRELLGRLPADPARPECEP
ncbi:MAG: hypothetical protein AUG88_04535 [Actinobacteria bacterium 13_1_20CM_4_68_12]|nr:MAG: hypothetical protein AUG88_04535 [Actinobacteria bacterium 13_1_20CM_4_68_12]